jgi:hypothetical protein
MLTWRPTPGALRRSVTIANRDDGDETSHFAYLHTSELFPTAIVDRRGSVSMPEETHGSAVGGLVVEDQVSPTGSKQTLDEYVVADHGIDGFIVLHHGRIVYEVGPVLSLGAFVDALF